MCLWSTRWERIWSLRCSFEVLGIYQFMNIYFYPVQHISSWSFNSILHIYVSSCTSYSLLNFDHTVRVSHKKNELLEGSPAFVASIVPPKQSKNLTTEPEVKKWWLQETQQLRHLQPIAFSAQPQPLHGKALFPINPNHCCGFLSPPLAVAWASPFCHFSSALLYFYITLSWELSDADMVGDDLPFHALES